MKEIPRNIPTGTGTFGLHSGQKGGKRPLSAAAGRQMEKPAGQWEWPAGRRDRRSNRSKPVAPGGGGSASAGRSSREADGKKRPTGQPVGRRVGAGGKERPAGQPVETGGPGRRRVGVGGEELPRGRREGAAGAATSGTAGRRRRGGTPERPTGRSDRRGNRQRRAVPEGGGSAAGQRAPAKKTPRSGTPGCRRTSRLQHNTYDT